MNFKSNSGFECDLNSDFDFKSGFNLNPDLSTWIQTPGRSVWWQVLSALECVYCLSHCTYVCGGTGCGCCSAVMALTFFRLSQFPTFVLSV